MIRLFLIAFILSVGIQSISGSPGRKRKSDTDHKSFQNTILAVEVNDLSGCIDTDEYDLDFSTGYGFFQHVGEHSGQFRRLTRSFNTESAVLSVLLFSQIDLPPPGVA